MEKYDHKSIEQKWRQIWDESKIYQTPTDATTENKRNILPQLPYPSGAGLHAGHSEVYTACDIYARYERMQGKKVLQVIGWDAFGLPAENYAIKTNIHPRINTDKAIENFIEQIKSLGISVDWERSVGSHEPDYYKWTQWFFLLMHERGLAYRSEQQVNWCPSCKTVLANEQVENGHCERCDHEVEQKMMEQWYLKITDYADRLHDDLDKVDWPAETVKRQRDWIGRSQGAQIKFGIKDSTHELEVFTTAHDTIYGVTFMVVAPEHPILVELSSKIENYEEVEKYVQNSEHKTELERQQQKEKTGVELKGIVAINPINGEEIPVYVADYVLVGYGSGAIMAVPGHDERDFEFAEKYQIDIVYVVEGADSDNYVSYSKQMKGALESHIISNSAEFDGQTYDIARKGILDKLVELGAAEAKTEYKLRDWSVSRQRFWGAPIPMVFDPEGNPHPIDKADLPVILPDDVDFVPTGRSPLTESDSFQDGVEEKYGKGWHREVDTLDTFMCSSWYFFRYADPNNSEAFASAEALKTWLPVDFYLGGPEHVNGHLLYSRFFTKVLFDAGYIDFDEPFLVHKHQGTIFGTDGRKMSKRWGNVINPTEVVAEYGADTVRTYLMFMGPLEQDKAWNTQAVQGVRRFMQRIYNFNQQMIERPQGEVSNDMHKLIATMTDYIPGLRFNVAIAKCMEMMNQFERSPEDVTKSDWETFLTLIAPFAPSLTEELWQTLGHSESIHLTAWPEFDPAKILESEVEIVVQVNGKRRDGIVMSADASEEEVVAAALASDKVAAHIVDKEIKRKIYVPGKIVNIVV